MSSTPNTAYLKLKEQANKFFNEDRYLEAITLYLEILEKYPNIKDTGTLMRLSYSYENTRNYEKALIYFKKGNQISSVTIRKTAQSNIKIDLNNISKRLLNYWRNYKERPNFILFEKPKELKEVHLKNCKILPNRNLILNKIPSGTVVCEIGTLSGAYAREIMNRVKPSEFHIFDIDFSSFDYVFFQEFIDSGLVKLHLGDSSTELAKFEDAYFDFIYIDGDHSYEGAKKDAEVAHSKLKLSGIIGFNDYTTWSPLESKPYGVVKVANDIIHNHNYQAIYLGFNPEGYHDLFVKK